MQWESWGGSSNALIEQAKEELEILEYQHPDKFDSLKQELKSFISELQSQQNLLQQSSSISPCPSAATQESSSRKKRKKIGCVVEEAEVVEVCSARKVGSRYKRKCKTDAVLERAQQCLHKIQNFKTSFCS